MRLLHQGSIAILVLLGFSGAPCVAQAAMPATGVGLPLPLEASETFVPFANGCGSIMPLPLKDSILTFYQDSAWYGACRFGVAHGAGLLQPADSNPIGAEYYYGSVKRMDHVAGALSNLTGLHTQAAEGNEVPNEELFFNSQPLGDAPIGKDTSLKFANVENGKWVTHTIQFYDMPAPCYSGRMSTPKDWKLVGDVESVRRLCEAPTRSSSLLGAIVGPGGMASNVPGYWHQIDVAPASAMKTRALAVQSQKRIQQEFHICSTAAGTCNQTFLNLIGPLLPRMQAVKVAAEAAEAERKAKAEQQVTESLAKVQARFAPLEARRASMMQTFAKVAR